MENQSSCPICKTPLPTPSNQLTSGDFEIIDCPRCGKYQASRRLLVYLQHLVEDGGKASLLSYMVRKMQAGKEKPVLNTYNVEIILKNKLPNLSEQINNLILWLGDSYGFGEEATLPHEMLETIIGASSFQGLDLIIKHLNDQGLIKTRFYGGGTVALSLEFDGWQYYDEIKRGATMSRKAFMAMKFGDKELDSIFENYFKPAVKVTGFDLYRLDERPMAGLIDDRLRIEIRTSRFLISDLTHENPGAYWEAGFAEGLGKPVIYTCEKTKFESQKTHFDTNHHLTIMWEKDYLEDAVEKLKATIRTTLPSESKLTDE